MTRDLHFANKLSLPVDIVTQTIAVVAKRRAGKSYWARRLAEQLHKAGQQICIIDPKGDWWGIQSSADGKGPGLPIVILGGERGRIPLEPGGGDIVAKLVAEDRVSVLLDLSLFRKHERATFMAAFLEGLYRLKAREQFRTPVMLLCDEADEICPQKSSKGIRGGNIERMAGAFDDIVRRGGQRGIGCTMITQRTAVLNKDVLTQAQILVALRTIAPQDLKAMRAWIDVHGTEEQRKTLMESLPSLPIGDSWVWSPGWPTDEGIFRHIHTLPIETFDSGATPKPGQRRVEPKGVADVDIEAVSTAMAETIKRAKAEDPKFLRARIAELERAAKTAAPPPAPAPAREQKVKRVEVQVFRAGELHRLEKLADRYAAMAEKLHGFGDGLANALARANAALLPATAPPAPSPARAERTIAAAAEVRKTPGTIPARVTSSRSNGGGLPAGERAVLLAIAQLGPVQREQLTVITGYKRSTRNTYLQKLSAAGLIDIFSNGDITVTDPGREALGDFKPLPTGKELREHYLQTLPAGEASVLSTLIDVYPKQIERDALSEATGYTRSTRNTYLQKLGARRLVTTSSGGLVSASAELFT